MPATISSARPESRSSRTSPLRNVRRRQIAKATSATPIARPRMRRAESSKAPRRIAVGPASSGVRGTPADYPCMTRAIALCFSALILAPARHGVGPHARRHARQGPARRLPALRQRHQRRRRRRLHHRRRPERSPARRVGRRRRLRPRRRRLPRRRLGRRRPRTARSATTASLGGFGGDRIAGGDGNDFIDGQAGGRRHRRRSGRRHRPRRQRDRPHPWAAPATTRSTRTPAAT